MSCSGEFDKCEKCDGEGLHAEQVQGRELWKRIGGEEGEVIKYRNDEGNGNLHR